MALSFVWGYAKRLSAFPPTFTPDKYKDADEDKTQQLRARVYDEVERKNGQPPCFVEVSQFPSESVAQVQKELTQLGWKAYTNYYDGQVLSVFLNIVRENKT